MLREPVEGSFDVTVVDPLGEPLFGTFSTDQSWVDNISAPCCHLKPCRHTGTNINATRWRHLGWDAAISWTT